MTMSSPSVIREEDPSYTLGDDVWRIKYSLSPNSSHSEDENTSANPRPSNEQGWSWLMTTVMQLCLELWPDKERPDFNLERMQGGTFNRIIGITAAGTGLPNNGRYILRIPRSTHRRLLAAELAIGKFLESINIPCAATVAADLTSNNMLATPWFLQERVDGEPLDYLWDRNLNFSQKICIAKQLGQILNTLHSHPRSQAGTFDASSTLRRFGITESPQIPFDKTTGHDCNFSALSTRQHDADPPASCWDRPPGEMVAGSLRLWRYYRNDNYMPWECMAKAAELLTETGAFDGKAFYLAHHDLFPRNIMARIVSPFKAEITAILDWDDAAFVPLVVACFPPAWMWFDRDNDEIAERDHDLFATQIPRTQGTRNIKKAFEKAVGPDYLNFAYHQDGHEARTLYRYAVEGSNVDWHRREIRDLLVTLGDRHGVLSDLIQPDGYDPDCCGWSDSSSVWTEHSGEDQDEQTHEVESPAVNHE